MRVTCLTDPADPWSWAAEPARRRLLVEFGEEVQFTYVMAGLAREVADPGAMARRTLEAAAAARMPADARIWLDGAPSSTYPACLAVKAAADQGLDEPVLRVLREGFMVDRRRLDNPDALIAAVRDVPGLHLDRFALDLRSNAIVEAFGADLDVARDGAGEAPKLPQWRVGDQRLEGEIGVEALRAAVLEAGATPSGRGLPSPEEAVLRFGRIATAEVAAVCGLAGPRAPLELWRLAAEWRVRAEPVLGGELWRPA